MMAAEQPSAMTALLQNRVFKQFKFEICNLFMIVYNQHCSPPR
jgi:hypothetical protein